MVGVVVVVVVVVVEGRRGRHRPRTLQTGTTNCRPICCSFEESVGVVCVGSTGTRRASHAAGTEAEKGKPRGEGREKERRCRRETDDMARRISDTPPAGTRTERGEQGEKGPGEGRGGVVAGSRGAGAAPELASALPLPCLGPRPSLDRSRIPCPPS